MNQTFQETTDKTINRAIEADEQANANYYRILRRFLSGKARISGEKPLQPEARLNVDGLKEIAAAWVLLQTSGKNLRKSYMKLYVACL